MTSTQTDAQATQHLRLWLLGILPDEESRLLEQRLITDSELYEELLVIEDELIDEYIAGTLTANEHSAFKSYFMNSPERQEQFRIANALKSYIDTNTAPNHQVSKVTEPTLVLRTSKKRFISRMFAGNPAVPATVAAAVLLVCGVVWFGWYSRSVPSGSSLSVVLIPGGQTREGGSAVQEVVIPPGTTSVEFQLRLARNDFEKYRGTLLNSEGSTIVTRENLTSESMDSQQQAIRVPVDAERIGPGEYRLKLDGVTANGKIESADSYRFVVRE